MAANISLVQRVEIASPCPAKWEDMAGDDKSRFCSLCKLNVYNLTAMTEAEAERLIIEKEGKLCARIYRRADGTILTRDCPVGLAAIRRHVVRFGLKIAAMVVLMCGLGATIGTRRSPSAGVLEKYPPLRSTPYQLARDKVRNWTNSIAMVKVPGGQRLELGRMAIPVTKGCRDFINR